MKQPHDLLVHMRDQSYVVNEALSMRTSAEKHWGTRAVSLVTALWWLFGFVNAMNGTCYLPASALLNNGDWSVVISDLSPAWIWRAAMGVVGLGLYFAFVRWSGT